MLKYLQDSLTETVDQPSPLHFDPTNPDVTEWFSAEILAISETPARASCEGATVVVRLVANSKSQTTLYRAEKLLDDALGYLTPGSVIGVTNYSTDTQLGTLHFRDSQSRIVNKKTWNTVTCDITAKYYEVV